MYNSMFMTWRDQAELWKHLWYYTVLKIRDPISARLNHTFKEQMYLESNELKDKDEWMTQTRHSISWKKMELWNLQKSNSPCLIPLVWSDGMLCLDVDSVPWLLNGRLFCRVSQPFFCGADTLHILRYRLPTLFYNLQRNITVILLKLLHIKWLWLSEIPHISLTGFPYLTNATVLPSKIPRQVKLWSLFSPLEVYT